MGSGGLRLARGGLGMDTRSVVRHHGSGDTGGCSGAIPVLCVTGDKGISAAPLARLLPSPQVLGCSGKPSPGPAPSRGMHGRIWGGFGALLARRLPCLALPRVPSLAVLCGPFPAQPGQSCPGRARSWPGTGASHVLCCASVTALRFLGLFAPSCCAPRWNHGGTVGFDSSMGMKSRNFPVRIFNPLCPTGAALVSGCSVGFGRRSLRNHLGSTSCACAMSCPSARPD